MSGRNVTQVDLSDAVSKRIGLVRLEATDLVRQTLDEICSTLAAGEIVKLSLFGIFSVRDKAKRVGRNPKTGEVVPVEARQSITSAPRLFSRRASTVARRSPAQSKAEWDSGFGGLIRNSACCCYSG